MEKEKIIIPNLYQIEALQLIEQTEKETDRGIVAMPTGSGKTWLSALWIKQKLEKNLSLNILFVCHNGDILSQANEQEFQKCLKDLNISYGYYKAEEKNIQTVTFATTQCLIRNLEKFNPIFFDYIIIDEAHHYQADTFKKIGTYFKPKFLLCLTATPYKNRKVLFDVCGKVIYHKKTGDGIRDGLLCKFEYYWVKNSIDFSKMKWNGNDYDDEDVNRKICIPEYDDSILKEYKEIIKGQHQRKKTIGFCATVEHVERMTKLFNKNGISAIGLTAKTSKKKELKLEKRKKINEGFKNGRYEIIFVRDLYNEGMDIPDADCLMILRHTKSSIVFTQQIGRGLRKKEGKDYCLISDFTTNHKRCSINFDVLSEIIGVDIRKKVMDKVKKEYDGEIIKKSEIVVISNGCEVKLTRKEIDIIKENKFIFTYEQEREIKELYENGIGSSKIAKKFKCYPITILNILRELGVKIRRLVISKKQEREIKELYENGMIINQIADKFNCSVEPISNLLNKLGIKRRKGESKKIFNQLQEREIKELYENGMSAVEIADKLKCGSTAIFNVLKRTGTEIRSRKRFNKEQEQEIKELYENGMSAVEIADKLKCGSETIRNILRELSIKIRGISEAKNLYLKNKLQKNLNQTSNDFKFPHIKIISPYIPKIISLPDKIERSGKYKKYAGMNTNGYSDRTTDEKDKIRPKIVMHITPIDNVLALESPDKSFIKELIKQGIKPKKVTIPNNREAVKLVNALIEDGYKIESNNEGIVDLTKENSFPIRVVNASACDWLLDTEEKYTFLWLDYCGAFSFYVRDLDIVFAKHFGDMKLILTYNLFDPIKDDENYYFTKVINYILKKNNQGKTTLIEDVSYRYKKNMYNIGFNIQSLKCQKQK